MGSYLGGILAAVALAAFILDMMRRGVLQVKFAALWLVVSIVLVVFAVLPAVPAAIAHALGFALPANLLFFLAAALLVAVSVQLSFEVGRLEARTRRLAEVVAILGSDLAEVRRSLTPEANPHEDHDG